VGSGGKHKNLRGGKEKKMIKGNFLKLLVILVALLFVFSCAPKKTVLEEERPAPGGEAKKAEEVAKPVKVAPAPEEKAPVEKKVEVTMPKMEEKAAPVEKAKAKEEEAKAEAKVAPVTKPAEVAIAPAKELYELEDIHFDFDKYNIREPDREILKRHAEWLKKNKDVQLVIEGHCDERGTAEYNLALGERRAKAAAKFLIDLGIDPARIKTISYGKEMPLDPGHNEEAWAKNRRAHFVVSTKK